MYLWIVVLVALFSRFSNAASLPRNSTEHEVDREKRDTYDMLAFLEAFGYLEPMKELDDDDITTGRRFHSQYTIMEAIRKYQEFNNLPQTGMLDKTTQKKMRQPRCGYRDILKNADPNSPQKYSHLGTKWENKIIKWKTVHYTNQLSRSQQRNTFKRAFKFWSDVTPLHFEETDGAADIDIKFARREHGDGWGNAFDGRDHILAHAFGPGTQPISGDTHFDDDEEWTVHDNRGTDLETVAAHEFGHALGLGHSSVPGSLMAPYYQGWNPNFKLAYDDIRGIQLLYGSNPNPPKPDETTTTTTPRPTPRPTQRPTRPTQRPTPRPTQRPTGRPTTKTPSSRPYYCDMKLDAIDMGSDGYMYAFNGRFVYKTSPYSGLVQGYPKRINRVFPGAPSRVRGVVYDKKTGQVYIFKGTRVWRYSNFELEAGFPRQIDMSGFPERPHALLALTTSRHTTQILMFGYKYFWEWNQDTMKMTPGYILQIPRFWRGVPNGVEAAMTTLDGKNLFFKGRNFRKMDPAYRVVMEGYPKPWSPEIFGDECAQASDFTNEDSFEEFI